MTLIGPKSNWFISQRLRLHYVDWGNEGAPILLLVHGGRDHCRSWDWMAQELQSEWHVIAPDLRGHGNSAWSPDANYEMPAFVSDLAQLVHQFGPSPVTIVGHSLGGNISTRFTGLYPEQVRRLVAIEGLGLSLALRPENQAIPLADRWRKWIADRRAAAGRLPRRYPTTYAAYERMREENPYLTEEQARHLTVEGMNRNEDGSWSWKFDNYLNVWPFDDLPMHEIETLWAAITCPTLLIHGADSWVSNPERRGWTRHFHDVRVVEIERAGHWVHHDRLKRVLEELRSFLV